MVLPLIIAGVGTAISLALQAWQGSQPTQNKPQIYVTDAPKVSTNYIPIVIAIVAIFFFLMVIKR